MSIEFLREGFAKIDDEEAIVSPGGRCTFGELDALCRRWSAELDREDVRSGAVVSLNGDFSPSTVAVLLALAERNAIASPQRSGASRVERERHDEIAQVEVRCRVGDDGVTFDRLDATAAHPLYDELRARGRPGLVQFSSGTSGEPKAAVHDLVLLLEKFRTRRPALATLAFLSFDHLGGLNTMFHTLSNGAKLVSPADRSPESVCRAIEEQRVELLPATPSFFNLLLVSGAHRRHDLGSLQVISYGAEAMPDTTLARLRAAFPGVRLQQTYGMIELGALRTKSRDDGSLWVKIGGEGYETRVVNGVLQVRARSMLLGYLNASVPLTDDGWFVTGDMVEQDGEYLRFLGRDSDLINVGGEKVYPAEIEGVIESMDGVAEATVYGEPNGIVGQIVCAKVTRTGPGDETRFAAEVKRFCRERLARFKVPMRVIVTDERQFGSRYKKHRRVR